MKKYGLFVFIIILGAMQQSCGQKTKTKPEQNQIKMDTSKLINATVKAAFDAWQKGDAKTFQSFLTADAKLYDDGSPRNLQGFIKDACGHERLTSISKIEDNGLSIYGHYHTESWGDFNTYFKFHINNQGKIERLDIGQAS